MSILWWVVVFCVEMSAVKSDLTTEIVTGLDSEDSRPNILLIMADDMGWGDMGANWNKTRDTPNLDALAREGLRLVDFHSGTATCAPSRAALLTGRLGLRTGVTKNFGSSAVGGLPSNETTVASVLRDAGYRTSMIGKWHLGVREGFHPLDHGFDSYLGVPFSIDMACADPPGADLPPCPACPSDSSAEYQGSCLEDLALPLLEGRRVIHQPVRLDNVSTAYARFGEDFIANKSSAPFFLYAALSHVHVPHASAKGFEGPGNEPFAAALREMDWLVGRLAAAARAASSATTRDTLLWFLSDNGPWELKCSLAGSAGPFQGRWQRSEGGGGGGSASKQTVWEGGHRVPALVHWPSRVQAGRVSSALSSALDIFPTLAAVAGAPLPRYRALDGRDLSPVLLRDGLDDDALDGSEERVLLHQNSGAAGEPGDIGAVRIGRLKTVYYSGGSPACGGKEGPRSRLDPPLVFDLDADPEEAYPLPANAAAHARAAASAALANFAASLQKDNTSRADYDADRAARPCCDATSPICRCPWDQPTLVDEAP